MPIFSRKNKYEGQPPHTWYPDILHWREGDSLFCSNVQQSVGFLKVKPKYLKMYFDTPKDEIGFLSAKFTYKSVDASGMIFVEDVKGHLHSFEFWRFIKSSDNLSLKSREIKERQANSESYMELIQNFQTAFNELQEKDEHPKRLGD